MGIIEFFKRRSLRRHPGLAPVDRLDPRELFVREVEATLQKDPRNSRVRRLDDRFAIEVERGGERPIFNLANLFAESRELSPEQRQQRIQRFLAAFDEVGGDSWSEARSLLRLTLRPSTAGTALDRKGDLLVSAARSFLPGLCTMVVVDKPNSMMWVTTRQLDQWKVTEAQLFAEAEESLKGFSTEVELYDQSRGPVFTLCEEDDYASSRLLLPGFLQSFEGRVDGRPLAILPERNTLLITGDQRPDQVQWLADRAAREFRAAPRPFSPAVYSVDKAGAVIPYERPGHDLLAEQIRHGHAALLSAEYGRQKALLEAEYKRHGRKIFVADCTLARAEGGRLLSYCIWPDATETLLPRADLIIVCGRLGTSNEWSLMVPFEVAREIARDVFEDARLPFGPERFRVAGRFSDAQKMAFAAAEVHAE